MPRDDDARPSGEGAGSSPPAAQNDHFSRLPTLLLQGLPLIFGIGFIAPLIAQALERVLPGAAQAEWPLVTGLVIGGSWGALATLRGRWL